MSGYYMPTNINFGRHCLMNLAETLKHRAVKKVLIFTGNKSAEISGALQEVKDKLSGYKVMVFKGIQSNPTIESLKKGIGICRKEDIDLIIAVGGGSVIDYAKAVSVLSKEKASLDDFFCKKRRLKGRKITFIAVSTTFGTSSEVTPYAVMTDKKKGIKITLAEESMYPDYAFTDPRFSLTMPKPLIAASCADILSHAIEAYWNVNATETTDRFAALAIKLFFQYYKQTYQKPRNLRIREKISLAGIYAGLAFSNTRTTACHSISYPMTVIFNIPHGIACALTLGAILKFNAKTKGKKIARLCRLMDCVTAQEAQKKINLVLDNLGIKRRLRDYGLAKNDLKVILDKGFTPERMVNNPRKVRKEDLKKILEGIY